MERYGEEMPLSLSSQLRAVCTLLSICRFPNIDLVDPISLAYRRWICSCPCIDIDDLPFLQKLDRESPVAVVRKQMRCITKSQLTSSVGIYSMLFHLIGVCNEVTYDTQAAMEMKRYRSRLSHQ